MRSTNFPTLDKNYKHTIEVVVDRLVNDEASRTRLAQSVEQALELADGRMTVLNADTNEEFQYSLHYACPDHPDIAIPELEPRTFSFNSPHGACPVCTGLGSRLEVDPELVIPNGRLTIAEGAIRPFNRVNVDNWYMKKLQAVADHYGFSLHVPTSEVSAENIEHIMYGTGNEKYRVSLGHGRTFETTYEGVVPNLGTPPQGDRKRLYPPRYRAFHAGKTVLQVPWAATQARSAGGDRTRSLNHGHLPVID